jgi:hypothetical protein
MMKLPKNRSKNWNSVLKFLIQIKEFKENILKSLLKA